ncbi:MAG: tRNA (adenosine(37)-N6)-threonylcarbamoyltransferase complex ATPase subunit type 1 TsaE [Lachnospiraceae bacterium]
MSDNKAVTMESFCSRDTFELGRMMGEKAEPGMIFCLSGDLGTGKTVFSKGLAKGLGITEPVVSPTFTIVQEYKEGRIPFYHFDTYRIADPEEMYEIGFDDYLYGNGVCLIEWPENVQELLTGKLYHVTIEKIPEKGPDYRKITLTDNFD